MLHTISKKRGHDRIRLSKVVRRLYLEAADRGDHGACSLSLAASTSVLSIMQAQARVYFHSHCNCASFWTRRAVPESSLPPTRRRESTRRDPEAIVTSRNSITLAEIGQLCAKLSNAISTLLLGNFEQRLVQHFGPSISKRVSRS